ncbi:NAD-dependent epimerase/dehydratase family protein [Candidatus Gracilibacteria bacterium]|nr:NAD-dependent epimerase/dehydratase family protein [Candidatus Gracilibacteria bacterium]MCF7898537.1 NAD-dependent epimerase/dehydratase family protein [Candidatus Paceibacterota bacterium]
MNTSHTTKHRAIITGGAGFIGSYVVNELMQQGYEPIVIDNLSKGKKENIPSGVIFHQVNILDKEKLEEIIEEGDVIFHLAALTSVPESIENPLPYHKTNIEGTYTLLEVARIKKVKGIIFSSSAAVYGNKEGIANENDATKPESPYGLHKLIGEQLLETYNKLYGISTVSLRYFNVYGKGQPETGSYAPVMARFLREKRLGNPLPIVGDGSQTRDFVNVIDVAKANVKALELMEEKKNFVINICGGKEISVKEVADMISDNQTNIPPRIEIMKSCGNNSVAKEKLKWNITIPFEKGIEELLLS